MKKKISAFLLAFNIFAYTTICCYVQPVFALPVISSEAIINGLITLLFSLGVTVDLANLSEDAQLDKLDDSILNVISTADDNLELLQNQYATLKNNLQNGYIKCGVELWQFLQDNFYNDVVRPVYQHSFVPLALQSCFENNGYYFYFTNYYYSSYVQGDILICIRDGNFTNISYINPPTDFRSFSSRVDKNFANLYGISGTVNRTNYILVNGSVSTEYTGGGTDNIVAISKTNFDTNYSYKFLGYYVANNTDFISLTDVSENDFDVIINGVWDSSGSDVLTADGVYPQVISKDIINDYVEGINNNSTTWEGALLSVVENEYPENPAVPDNGLDLSTLDNLVDSLQLERLETKFPFCIPNDLMLIMNGATAVSSNCAPVIEIPLRLEFDGTVYYDNDKAIVIDFNDFSGVVAIFREGFFLLFLIALLWVSIDILQAFFVVTE